MFGTLPPVFLGHSPPYFFEAGSLTEPQLTYSTKQAGSRDSSVPVLTAFQLTEACVVLITSPGHHACCVNTAPSEPYPQPFCFFLRCLSYEWVFCLHVCLCTMCVATAQVGGYRVRACVCVREHAPCTRLYMQVLACLRRTKEDIKCPLLPHLSP